MQQKLTICVPSYGKKIRNQYILARLLNSFLKLPSDKFRVIIFNTNDPLDDKVTEGYNKLIQKFKPRYEIMQVTVLDIQFLCDFLLDKEFNGIAQRLTVKGYSNFRNIMLVVANILRSKVILMIDDDEVVENKKFIDRALEFIGDRYRGKILYAKTGYYIYEGSDYKLIQRSPIKRKLWLKETYINEALEKIIKSKKRLNQTTMAFGGIMVLHKNIYTKLSFDPNCPRGEDTDYMINAKQFGFEFLLDNKLKIKHLPPKKSVQYWDKLRQDIYRFIYTREKLKYFNKISVRQLEPYPAIFLKDDLDYRAVVTSVNYAKRSLKKKDYVSYKESFKNVELVFKDAKIHAVVNAPRYFEFQKLWQEMMKDVPNLKGLRKHFNRF